MKMFDDIIGRLDVIERERKQDREAMISFMNTHSTGATSNIRSTGVRSKCTGTIINKPSTSNEKINNKSAFHHLNTNWMPELRELFGELDQKLNNLDERFTSIHRDVKNMNHFITNKGEYDENELSK